MIATGGVLPGSVSGTWSLRCQDGGALSPEAKQGTQARYAVVWQRVVGVEGCLGRDWMPFNGGLMIG